MRLLLKKLLIISFFLFFAHFPSASSAQTSPKPILVLKTQTWSSYNPWIGPPQFVFYENGTMIFYKNGDFYSVTLKEEEKKAFLDSLPLKDFFKDVKPFYKSSKGRSIHPSVTYLMVWQDGNFKKVVMEELEPKEIPKPVSLILDKINSFSAEGSKPWLPDQIEAFLVPAEARGTLKKASTVPWPKIWPSLAQMRLHEDKKNDDLGAVYMRYPYYSFQIPSSQYEALLVLEKDPRIELHNYPVLIDGKPFRFNDRFPHRFPFPSEEVWVGQIR